MQDLLADSHSLGAIRHKVVNISGTVYPEPGCLAVGGNARARPGQGAAIKNPVESAFFLWVNIAYLQPFEDGNKRTSRLSPTSPDALQLRSAVVHGRGPADYAHAMLGVYEL